MSAPPRARVRNLGLAVGRFKTGKWNAITDVDGVQVGHVTRIEGDSVRTGVTAILPHPGNMFQERVPAGAAVANGYGKPTGFTQLVELGEIETPVILTNTLAVPQACDALIHSTLQHPGNENVRSVNPVVGETNDGLLNNIRLRVLTREDVLNAIAMARDGVVAEGNVGAGTGTIAFGWKAGIGTSSRSISIDNRLFTLGVLVQANYGGQLRILGKPIRHFVGHPTGIANTGDGSIMIVVATDAPLSDRNLTRLANRCFVGLARTGSAFSNGSGDYAIAFSTALDARRTLSVRRRISQFCDIPNDLLSPLFEGVADATEEAIYNSLAMAHTLSSIDPSTGRRITIEALDIDVFRSNM